MKRFAFVSIVMAALSAVACVEETPVVDTPSDSLDLELVELSFDASLGPQSKVGLGDPVDGGYKTFWSVGDNINVFAHDTELDVCTVHEFTSDLEQPSATAVFSGLAPVADKYYAVYPVISPSWSQEDKQILIMFPNHNTHDLYPLLVAKSVDGHLNFRHLTGYLKFTIPETLSSVAHIKLNAPDEVLRAVDIYVDPETLTISKVDVTRSFFNMYPLEGEDIIPPGNYYMTLLPGVLENGFSLEFYDADGLRYIKSTSKEVEIKAGEILNLGVMDDVKFDWPVSSIAEVNAGNDGDYFRVQGYVDAVADTQYGNWYLYDGENTEMLYIYGTVNQYGNHDWESLDLVPGDFVTVQGPKKTYRDKVELVDVSVVDVKRTLVRVVSTSFEGREIAAEGETITVDLSVQGDDLSVGGHLNLNHVETTQVGEYTRVTFSLPANAGAKYSGSIYFEVNGTDGERYWTWTDFTQAAGAIDASAAEVNAGEDNMMYRVTGYVSRLANTTYGNHYLKDFSGEVYVYGAYDLEGNRYDAFQRPFVEGDIITVAGYRVTYKGQPQLQNVTVRKHVPVLEAKVGDILDLEDSEEVAYRLTGVVSNIKNDLWGNFDLVDETGTVYVYGLLAGLGGPSKQFQSLGIKEGDTVTLVGYKGSCLDTPEIMGAFYISHTPTSSDDLFQGDIVEGLGENE